MYGTFWALVPPLFAIILALCIKEAYSSLFLGVILGALFLCNFNPVATLDTVINDGLIASISGNAGIFVFLVILGIIVALVNKSGGSAAFGRWAKVHVKSRVGAMLATFALGILIFIDDYFNCLTVGSVMRPVTDAHKMSRAKLAWLIDATAAPICMIAPISSWAAAVSGVANDLGTGISGIQLFISAIPYNFYSLLTFVFVIALALMKFDYGPMKVAEMAAELEGNNGAIGEDSDAIANPKGKVVDLIIPVIVLIITCTIGMIYVGGFWDGETFIDAFGNTDAFVALPWGGIIALIFAVIYFLCRRVMTFKEAAACVPQGFIAMVPPILILTLAVSLKSMTSALGAAEFVHGVMEGAASGLFNMLPAVIFIVACFLAFSSGTSWGTFGILIPIVMAIFEPTSPLLIIGISACCAGAVYGDHVSPISDTTIMSSAGAGCDHLQHVSTQFPYATTVAVASFVTYIFAGFVQNALISVIFGAIIVVAALFVIRSIERKKAA